MQFSSVSEFMAMGGYGFYVWLAFGLSFVSLVGLYLDSWLTKKSLLKAAILEYERKQRMIQAQQEGHS